MATNNIQIIKNSEDATIDFILQNEAGQPYPLSPGFEGATAYFPQDPSGGLSASGAVVSCGVIQVMLPKADTANLLEGEAQAVQLDFVVNGVSKSIIFEGVLNVRPRLF